MDRQLAEIARDIVADCHAAELGYFDQLLEKSLNDDTYGLPGGGKQETLGFGVGDLASVITPIVVSIITAVATDGLADLLVRTSKGRRWWRPRRRQSKVDAVPLVDAPTALAAGAAAEVLAVAIHIETDVAIQLKISVIKRLGNG